MNKIFYLLIITLFLSNCSVDTKSGIWSKPKKIKNQKVVEKIFDEKEVYDKEFNTELKINLKENYKENSFINNLTNNNGLISFDGKLKKVSKYKFKKISQFDFFQPELLISDLNNIIFFDDKGTILNFDQSSKIIWKKNIYKKSEKKNNPILYFAANKKILIVADNVARYHAINLSNGETIWSKRNSSPFNSQVKIYKDKFFVIDSDNVLRCFSIENGKELWNFKTEKSFIKSQQKLSLVISENKVIFLNTLGDVSSVNIDTGKLLWQTPTQSTAIYESSFTLKNSDLIVEKNIIYFSNNKNQFYALNKKTGVILWKQNLNSNLRPSFIDGLVFTITIEGYLAVIDGRNGNIVRMTNVTDKIKKYKKKDIKPVGFIIGKENIYASYDNGIIVVINVQNGKSLEIVKIDNEKISRPYIFNNEMFIIKDNAILKLN